MRRPPSSDAIHDHVYDASICAMRDHLRAFGVCLFYDASTTLSVVSVYVASDTIASTTRDPTLPTLGLRPTAFATTFGDQEALLGARPTGASTGASTTSDNRLLKGASRPSAFPRVCVNRGAPTFLGADTRRVVDLRRFPPPTLHIVTMEK